MKIGIYSGSFDPITYGHVDIIKRSLKLVDKLIIAILHNPNKNGLFDVNERVKMISTIIDELIKSGDCKNGDVEVETFDGLLVDFALKKNANIVVRGVRNIFDCQYEIDMATINNMMMNEIETVMLVSGTKYKNISSSVVKEIASFGGKVTEMVPECVNDKLIKKFR